MMVAFARGRQAMATDGGSRINEDDIYNEFPRGADDDAGPDEGFNTWVRVNDEALFTPEALRNPAVRAFVQAPFSVNYGQFKSSHRETEYFIHKPVRAMSGQVDGIVGTIAGFPSEAARIATLVINHELSLAKHITRSVVIEDGNAAGQLIHKEEYKEEAGSR
jgi:hypothetical protein